MKKNLYLRVITVIAPATGRRRVWNRMADLEARLASAHERIDAMAQEKEVLLGVIDAAHEDILTALRNNDALQEKIDLSAWAREVNTYTQYFEFASRDMTPVVDEPTYPIDVRELRASMDEAVTGKVTQLNPDTDEHETVEVPLPVKKIVVRRIPAVQRGKTFASATHIPGALVS